MILNQQCSLNHRENPLALVELPDPKPDNKEILIKVTACGVCHTELDEIEGRILLGNLPIVLGHQVVGTITDCGSEVKKHKVGDRVGIGWIFYSCGSCEYCKSDKENLCPDFKATGRDINGGYAELMTINEDFAYPIPEAFTDTEAAPLLCAGAIGYRSLNLSGLLDHQNLGLTGFGAAGHLVLQLVKFKFPNVKIFVFARNEEERNFARELGAVWAGDIPETPLHEENRPAKLHTIIDTTPVWKPVVKALKHLVSGGRLVINAIRKEDSDKQYLEKIHYHKHLWMEKEIKTVANVTRKDITEFLEIAAKIPLKPEIEEYSFEKANQALLDLKHKTICGSKVLTR